MSVTQHDHVSIEMISTYARWCGIHSKEQWREYHQQNSRPSWVPDDPESFFSQFGEWQGWDKLTSEH